MNLQWKWITPMIKSQFIKFEFNMKRFYKKWKTQSTLWINWNLRSSSWGSSWGGESWGDWWCLINGHHLQLRRRLETPNMT